MKVHLIYFSPGGTTKKTVRNIAKGIKNVEIIEYDMLKKETREKKYTFPKDDIVILGMMTATKLFGIPDAVIGSLKGNHTPFVGVVMYANHYYGKSLIMMKKAMEKRGFNMVAGGAFIGQNSISTFLGAGRPDAKDEEIQLKFGQDIYEKIIVKSDYTFHSRLKMDWPKKDKIGSFRCAVLSSIPGLGGALKHPFNTLAVLDDCILCGKCIKHCPVGAITLKNKIQIDCHKCIGCAGCVSICPKKAIKFTNPIILRLNEDTKKKTITRREPEVFF